ncbi:lipid II flippase MurJ [Thermocrinis minervae]|uniref:Putative peptidoglycan lipid II flippase n=1 Tax=Thermocrinis minervae TaxID=381751 RepID=A0A1M6S9M8_9AQUI|nr:lipid II flippase MurJ [Thermocrinis minervae]SHK41389.1 putative peptidoglycan lipid II flippase [Thermocrinis minervae]
MLSRYLNFSKPERILEAVLKTSLINLFARGFGYLKNLSIAILLGFSHQTDGFFMAFSLMGIFLIFVDVFDSIGVPNLVVAGQQSKEEFEKLAGLLLTFTTILASLLTLLAFLSLPLLLKVPLGFEKVAIEYTKTSFVLLLPYLFFSFFFHHFGAVLRSQRLFTVYFVGELLFSFFSFLFITVGLYLYRDFRVIPISVSVAQLFATLYMLYMGRQYIRFNLFLDDKAKLMLKHFLYLVALYGVFHIFIVVDGAFGSTLGEKGVSALTYGLMLAYAPTGVLKFEHMAITSLSEVRGSMERLNFYLKRLFLLGITFGLFVFVFADLLVKVFFGHGAFTHTDVSLTATATRYYALSLPLALLWPVLYRVFQIRNNLLPVFFLAIVVVIVKGVINYLLVMLMHLGIVGVCLGTFFAYLMLCALGYIILKKMYYNHA